MSKTILSFLFLAALTFSCQHAHVKGEEPIDAHASDSIYTERAAMLVYANDPKRALAILDSAEVLGNIGKFEADLSRAMVYARTLVDPDPQKAESLCLDLLEMTEVQDESQESADRRLNVLHVLTDVYRSEKDYENWLQYSIELSEINRVWGYEVEALRTDAEIGVVLTQLGREQEGLSKLDRTLEELEKGGLSIDRMDAWIVAAKRKISVLEEQGKPEEVIPLAQGILDKLQAYELNPGDYAEDSFRLPYDPDDRALYCDFYRSQALCFLARSYAGIGDLRAARHYLSRYEKTVNSQTFSGRVSVSRVWAALGQWDKVLAVDAEVVKKMGTDTLNATYTQVLFDRSRAAAAVGRYRDAQAWMERYASLSDQLNRQLMNSQAQEYAALYHQQEQDLAIAEAQAKARRQRMHLWFLAIVLLFVSLALVYHGISHKRIKEKNKALIRFINEQSSSAKAAPSKPDSADLSLFREIDAAVRSERLYANVALQRQDIIDRWKLRRQTLNDLLSAAGYDSFPAYINHLRLEESVRLLREQPELPISSVAQEVGFSVANFRLAFKQSYGITPAEYRSEN